jgi:predicted MPP superfamily phosphohydrolase
MTTFRLILWSVMGLGQIISWCIWQRRLKNIFFRSIVKTVYLLINLVTVVALAQIFVLELIPPDHVLWTYFYRPALTWQFGHLMWLVLSFFIWIAALFWRRWVYRTHRGLPRLFRAPRGGITAFQVICLAWFLTLGTVFYGYSVQLRPAEVRRITLSYPGLPESLEGLTIAHLSDFHYGLGSDQVELEQRLTQTAALSPDLVIVTGDMLDTNAALAREWREPLKHLSGVPLGVYGVLGNHDIFTLKPQEEARIFDNLGLNILRNRATQIRDKPLTLVGIDDPGTRSLFFKADPQDRPLDFSAIPGLPSPAGTFVIVISHRPKGLPEAVSAGVPLFLAGHTHGGQIQMPWNSRWNLMTLASEYTEGVYYLNPTVLIISNGLSAAGLPFRLWAWPEIGLITLSGRPINPENNGQ